MGWNLAPSNIPNIGAVLFMWCTLPAYGASSYVPSLVLERPLFVRERNDGLYRWAEGGAGWVGSTPPRIP